MVSPFQTPVSEPDRFSDEDPSELFSDLNGSVPDAAPSAFQLGGTSTALDSFDYSGECELGKPESAPPASDGAATGKAPSANVSWEQWKNCIHFTNGDGRWTIYKTCKDETSASKEARRGVGPGYIAALTSGGRRIVYDFRTRDGSSGGAKDWRDADIRHPGSLGAGNGGLGAFEVQYARGVLGNTWGADFRKWTDQDRRNPNFRLPSYVAPDQLGLYDPLAGPNNDGGPIGGSDGYKGGGQRPFFGVLSTRICEQAHPGWGVFAITSYKPRANANSVDYQMDVWLRDPEGNTGFGPSTSKNAVVKITYWYRFYASEVASVIRVQTPGGVASSGAGIPLFKEPKVAATVRAEGDYTKIDVGVLPNNQGSGSFVWSAYKGQREQLNANLQTSHADANDRFLVRWSSNGDPCSPVLCLSVWMKGLPSEKVNRSSPFTKTPNPLLWESRSPKPGAKPKKYGLDGWALRAGEIGVSSSAYPNDTSGDHVVSTCKAEYRARTQDAKGVWHNAGDLILPRYEYPDQPRPYTWKQLSTISAKVRTDGQNVRRWEFAGWKDWAPGEKDASGKPVVVKNLPYRGSSVMFHAWEGTRGPNDCEPLMVPLGSEARSWFMLARYSIGGSGDLMNQRLPPK